MDQLRMVVAQLGIATIRKLFTHFEKTDKDKTGKVANEEFMSALMQNALHLSKIDLSNVLKTYKANDLETDYAKFMDDLSPELTAEREKVVKQLFDLVRAQSKQKQAGDDEDIILYQDLMRLCNFEHHPAVQSGQFSPNQARKIIGTAFDSMQNDKDEVDYANFKFYFRGIGSGYPYNTQAFIRFIQSCWGSLFEQVNDGNFSVDEQNEYIEQIEAMLAEKTRQKVKGAESENNTLLRQFKHFDIADNNYLNYKEFVRTLESFGVMAPAKDLTILFEKWCVEEPRSKDDEQMIKKLKYRGFVEKLFKKY